MFATKFSCRFIWFALLVFINFLPEWKFLSLRSLFAVGISREKRDQRVEVLVVNSLFAS